MASMSGAWRARLRSSSRSFSVGGGRSSPPSSSSSSSTFSTVSRPMLSTPFSRLAAVAILLGLTNSTAIWMELGKQDFRTTVLMSRISFERRQRGLPKKRQWKHSGCRDGGRSNRGKGRCRLAKELNMLAEDERWRLISRVWVEMLGYAAINCKTYYVPCQAIESGRRTFHARVATDGSLDNYLPCRASFTTACPASIQCCSQMHM